MHSCIRRAGVAAALALLTSSAAHAAINYSGVLNAAIPNNGTGLYVNVVDGSQYTGPNTFPTLPGPGANYDFNFFGTTAWSVFVPGSSGQSAPTPVPATSKGYLAATSTSPVSSLLAGDPIGPAQAYNSGSPAATNLVTGSDVLFGFRFRNENDTSTAVDDTVHFGWGRVRLTNGQPGTLVDYAWDNTANTQIKAGETGGGVVPEPASIGLIGLTSLALVRRRRSA